jgi:N-acetylmuramoyl-L-alanine amidase
MVLAVFSIFWMAFAVDHARAQAEGERHLAFDARIAGDELRTRIVVDFESEPDFAIHYLRDPARVIIDLPETVFGFEETDLEARGLFETIRYGAMGPGRSRMALTAVGPVQIELAKVEAREDGRGYRLVLDAVATSDETFAALVQDQDWQPTGSTARSDRIAGGEREDGKRPFTIVLDPGHGGIDGGARGPGGTEEKDITLAFARTIAEKLEEHENTRVVLTRDGDQFVPLAGRVRIARQHQADLMLSIHADSIRMPDIRGATVYTLSDKASDSMAADLARRENKADEVAGVAYSVQEEDVADILMDLTRRETQVLSVGLARSILDGLRGDVRLINNPHRYAGFSVLRAPDVPSLLLELGYLSNREDEKLLNDAEWRDSTSSAVAAAVQAFRKQIFAEAKDL